MSTSLSPTPSPIPSWNWITARPARLIAFGFGSGLAPVAPGTFGTLWAWVAGSLFSYILEPSLTECWLFIIFGLGLGIWACGQTGKDILQPDHGGMVWDEVIAFWIVLLFIMPGSFFNQLLAFAIFRVLDALKPGPIKSIDLFFKNWNPHSPLTEKWELTIRGFGVMVDDLAAAIGTLVLLAILYRFNIITNI